MEAQSIKPEPIRDSFGGSTTDSLTKDTDFGTDGRLNIQGVIKFTLSIENWGACPMIFELRGHAWEGDLIYGYTRIVRLLIKGGCSAYLNIENLWGHISVYAKSADTGNSTSYTGYFIGVV